MYEWLVLGVPEPLTEMPSPKSNVQPVSVAPVPAEADPLKLTVRGATPVVGLALIVAVGGGETFAGVPPALPDEPGGPAIVVLPGMPEPPASVVVVVPPLSPPLAGGVVVVVVLPEGTLCGGPVVGGSVVPGVGPGLVVVVCGGGSGMLVDVDVVVVERGGGTVLAGVAGGEVRAVVAVVAGGEVDAGPAGLAPWALAPTGTLTSMTSALIPTMLWITLRDRRRRSPSDPLDSARRLEDDGASPLRPSLAMVNMVVSEALIPIAKVRSDRDRIRSRSAYFR